MIAQRHIQTALLMMLFVSGTSFSQVVPPPKPEPAGPPLFVVSVNGKKGFINNKGDVLIAPIFQKAYPFSEGLAAVQVKGLWGFINSKGHIVIKPQFIMVGFFSEGMARFQGNSYTDPWGYIDKTGKVLIKQKFDVADRFRNGVARVGFATFKSKLITKIADVGGQYHYRFIDKNGKFVKEPTPMHYATGKPGELIHFNSNGLVGYIDSKGKIVIEPQFLAGSAFSEGLACVRKKDLYGYIDKTGKWVIPPRFKYPNDFSEGLAGVPLGAKGWGFIDRTGQVVIEPKFGWVYGGFRHGIVEVLLDGKTGYINKKGEWVWKPSI